MPIINPPAWMENGTYTAKMDRQVFSGFINVPGITSANAYKVSQTAPSPSMYLTIQAGAAYIKGTDQANQGMYHVFNEGEFDVNIVASHSVNPRIDLICIRVYDSEVFGSQNMAVIEVIQGQPSSSPVAPALPASSIPVCEVVVPANATAIVNSNLTDKRPIAKFHSSLSRNFVEKPEPWRSITGEGLYGPAFLDYNAAAYQSGKFRKFAGNVEMLGLTKPNGTIPIVSGGQYLTIFTLPVGYRPAATTLVRGFIGIIDGTTQNVNNHYHTARFYAKTARIQVTTAGLVQLYLGYPIAEFNQYTNENNAYLSLNGISFPMA